MKGHERHILRCRIDICGAVRKAHPLLRRAVSSFLPKRRISPGAGSGRYFGTGARHQHHRCNSDSCSRYPHVNPFCSKPTVQSHGSWYGRMLRCTRYPIVLRVVQPCLELGRQAVSLHKLLCLGAGTHTLKLGDVLPLVDNSFAEFDGVIENASAKRGAVADIATKRPFK